MGIRVPRERPGDPQEEDKPAEGEVEETEKGYEEAKKKQQKGIIYKERREMGE